MTLVGGSSVVFVATDTHCTVPDPRNHPGGYIALLVLVWFVSVLLLVLAGCDGANGDDDVPGAGIEGNMAQAIIPSSLLQY